MKIKLNGELDTIELKTIEDVLIQDPFTGIEISVNGKRFAIAARDGGLEISILYGDLWRPVIPGHWWEAHFKGEFIRDPELNEAPQKS